ncbi:hypothetical protein VNO78_27041 [Psophocarpus tetragonolobus]|uniref:Uncharacterized protein n=1 Tax=Psophocarpus tetragonolobus TaxID=3891 RepID=A0AAN9S0G8_PSOTE
MIFHLCCRGFARESLSQEKCFSIKKLDTRPLYYEACLSDSTLEFDFVFRNIPLQDNRDYFYMDTCLFKDLDVEILFYHFTMGILP